MEPDRDLALSRLPKHIQVLPVESETGAVYYAEARLAVVCKKLYEQDFDAALLTDERVKKIYSHGEKLHRVFVGEIVEVLMKED